MSNDLIKRMDAIENIWSLFNNTYNDAVRFDAEETELAKRILSDVQTVLEKQPTAYDVDKVMERLEEYARSSICKTHEHGCPYLTNDDVSCENCGAMGVVEIVKSGGIE